MTTKMNQKHLLIIAILSVNLMYCGKHAKKESSGGGTDLPVSEAAATNTTQLNNTSAEDEKTPDETPPADTTPEQKPIVRGLTPSETRDITEPTETAVVDPAEAQRIATEKQAKLDAANALQTEQANALLLQQTNYRQQIQDQITANNKKKSDVVEEEKNKETTRLQTLVPNPYKSNSNLLSTTVYGGDQAAIDVLEKDEITIQEKIALSSQYFKVLENKDNTNWGLDARLELHFLAAKENPGIRDDLKTHLGNFQGLYNSITDEKKKEILLPLMYAFNLYNKINGTNFNASQGPNVYTSKNDISEEVSTVVILGRVDLSSYNVTDNIVEKLQKKTNPLSEEQIKLSQAINKIWEKYYVRYLDPKSPLADPVLMGYSNKTDEKGKADAKIYAEKVKAASEPSYIPAIGEMTDFASLLDSYAASNKNKRVELVLSREVTTEGKKEVVEAKPEVKKEKKKEEKTKKPVVKDDTEAESEIIETYKPAVTTSKPVVKTETPVVKTDSIPGGTLKTPVITTDSIPTVTSGTATVVATANPYKGNPVLESVFTGNDAMNELVNKEQLTVEEKGTVAKGYIAAIESTNSTASIGDRLQSAFSLSKDPAIAAEMQKSLGRFSDAHSKLSAESKKMLLPFMYAFQLYNKVKGTNYTVSQAANSYTTEDPQTHEQTEVTVLARVSLADSPMGTENILTQEQTEQIRVIDQIWSAYQKSQTPIAGITPILSASTYETKGNLKKKNQADLDVVKLLAPMFSSSATSETWGNSSPLISTDPNSTKNRRIEFVLSKKPVSKPSS